MNYLPTKKQRTQSFMLYELSSLVGLYEMPYRDIYFKFNVDLILQLKAFLLFWWAD